MKDIILVIIMQLFKIYVSIYACMNGYMYEGGRKKVRGEELERVRELGASP